MSRPKVFLCGIHLRVCKERKELAKWTEDEQIERNREHIVSIVEARRRDEVLIPGLFRMLMMHGTPKESGILNVLPNFRSKSTWHEIMSYLSARTSIDDEETPPADCEFRCSELSPKFIGPINHGQPGLPLAKNLENFHQGSKCFSAESDEDFAKRRIEMFEDSEPHRHKWEKYPALRPKGAHSVGMSDIKYFEWIDQDNCSHHLTYLQSRQFYCTFYERAVLPLDTFRAIVALGLQGYSMRICGFDAVPIVLTRQGSTYQAGEIVAALDREYENPDIPFGHERVLFAMLLVAMKFIPYDSLPWITHRTFQF